MAGSLHEPVLVRMYTQQQAVAKLNTIWHPRDICTGSNYGPAASQCSLSAPIDNHQYSTPQHGNAYRRNLAAAACHKEFVQGISHLLANISQAQAAAVPAGAQPLGSVALTQHST